MGHAPTKGNGGILKGSCRNCSLRAGNQHPSSLLGRPLPLSPTADLDRFSLQVGACALSRVIQLSGPAQRARISANLRNAASALAQFPTGPTFLACAGVYCQCQCGVSPGVRLRLERHSHCLRPRYLQRWWSLL
jgi:hypothetical protein